MLERIQQIITMEQNCSLKHNFLKAQLKKKSSTSTRLLALGKEYVLKLSDIAGEQFNITKENVKCHSI